MSISKYGHRILIASASVLIFGGCDALVDPDYQGQRLGRIHGYVQGSGPTELDVMVLWYTANPGGECVLPNVGCGGGGNWPPLTVEEQLCVDACGQSTPNTCRPEILEEWESCVNGCSPDIWVEVYTLWKTCVSAAQGNEVTVKGMFPARFTLDLYDKPPAEAMIVPESGGPGVALGMIAAGEANGPPLDVDLRSLRSSDQIAGLSGTHLLMYADEPLNGDSGSPWPSFLGAEYEPGFHIIEVIDGDDQADTLRPSSEDMDTEISLELGSAEDLDWPSF